MKKVLQVSNIIALIITLVINYLSNTGIFNGNTMATVSARYQNYFTPAGYAFAIWGLIYLGLLAYVIYQAASLFKKTTDDWPVPQIGWWFVVSCAANSLWVFAWLYDYIGLSVVIMIVLLFSLIKIIWNTRMELDDLLFKKIAFVWWPFCLYSGWITVALIADIAAWLTKIQWNGFGISGSGWAIIMIIIAGIINLTVTWTRNMREYALVAVWALIAIAVANNGNAISVVYTAIIVAVILFISSGVHAYLNRKTLPINNLFNS
ncbi:MAG: hypothetical protein ACTHNG_11795 [Ginsengibacter sp.]|jgi:hypothetical protein